LYVTGFPPTTTKGEIVSFFEGITGKDTLESVFLGLDNNNSFLVHHANVCFKTEDHVTTVQRTLSRNTNLLIGGKTLIVNFSREKRSHTVAARPSHQPL